MSVCTKRSVTAFSEHQLSQKAQQACSWHLKQSTFFQAVLECLVDGILILSKEGEIVHANAQALLLCQKLLTNSSHNRQIPREVWRVCQSLIDSRNLFPSQQMVIESEVITNHLTPLRLRGRWLSMADGTRPFMLITLEDRHQSLQNLANTDMKQYGLTSREAEIWSLRRSEHSYKEIASKLYISENTVKKHMKNIHIKRKKAQMVVDYQHITN